MGNNPIFNPQQQAMGGDSWGQPNMQPIDNQWMSNNPFADQQNKLAPAMDMQQQVMGGNDTKKRPDARMNELKEINAMQSLTGQSNAMKQGMGAYKDMSKMPAMDVKPRVNRTGQQPFQNIAQQQQHPLQSMRGLLGY